MISSIDATPKTRVSNRFSTSSNLASPSTAQNYPTPPVPRMTSSPSQSHSSPNSNRQNKTSSVSSTSSTASSNTNIIPDPWVQLREAHHAQQAQHAARLRQLEQLEQQLADMANGHRGYEANFGSEARTRRTVGETGEMDLAALGTDAGYPDSPRKHHHHRHRKSADAMEDVQMDEFQRVQNQEEQDAISSLLGVASAVGASADEYLASIRRRTMVNVPTSGSTSGADVGRRPKGSASSSNRDEAGPSHRAHRNTISAFDVTSAPALTPKSRDRERDRDRDKELRKRTESTSSSTRASAFSSRLPQVGPQPQTSVSSSASTSTKRPASKHRHNSSISLANASSNASSSTNSPTNFFTGDPSDAALTSTITPRSSAPSSKRNTFGPTAELQQFVVPMMATLSAAADRVNMAIGYTPPPSSKARNRLSVSQGHADYHNGSALDQFQPISQSRRASKHQPSSQQHSDRDYYGQPIPSSSSPPLIGASHHSHNDSAVARRVRGYSASNATLSPDAPAPYAGYGELQYDQMDVENLMLTTPPPMPPKTPPNAWGEGAGATSANSAGKRKNDAYYAPVTDYEYTHPYDGDATNSTTPTSSQLRTPSRSKQRSLKSPPPPLPLDTSSISGGQSGAQRYSYTASPTGVVTPKTSKTAPSFNHVSSNGQSMLPNGDATQSLLKQRRKSLFDHSEAPDGLTNGTMAQKASARTSMPASTRATTPKSSGLSSSIGPDGTPTRTSFLPQPRSGSRTSSATGVAAPLPSIPIPSSNRSSNDLSSASSHKAEHRKSSTTPTRASLADYHGYINKAGASTRRRSGTYSPPPPTRPGSAGRRTPKEEVGPEEFIPPVPPVPKHHSLNSNASASVANTIKNLMNSNLSRNSSVSSRGKQGEEDVDGYSGHGDDEMEGRTDDDVHSSTRRRGSERTATEDEAGGDEASEILTSSVDSSKRRKKKVSLAGDVATGERSGSERKTSSRTSISTTSSAASKRKKSVVAATTGGSEKNETTRRIGSHATTTAPSTSFGTSAAVQTVQNKKTLPGSLATPPPVPSLPLPPMKVEPLNVYLPQTSTRKSTAKSPSRSIATTPTRIPTIGSSRNKSLSTSGGPYSTRIKDDGNGVGTSSNSDDELTPTTEVTPTLSEKKKTQSLLYNTLTSSTNGERSKIPPPSPKVGPSGHAPSASANLNSSVTMTPKTIRGGGLGSSTNSLLSKSGSEYSSTATLSKPSKENSQSALRKPSSTSKPSLTSSMSTITTGSNKDLSFSSSIDTSKTSRSRKMSSANLSPLINASPVASRTIGTSARRHSIAPTTGLSIQEQLDKEKAAQALHTGPKSGVNTVAAHGTMSSGPVPLLGGNGSYTLTGQKPVTVTKSSTSKPEAPNKALSLHDRLQGLVVEDQILEEDESTRPAKGKENGSSTKVNAGEAADDDAARGYSGTPSRSGASTSTGEEMMSLYVKNVPKEKDATKEKSRDKDSGIRVAMGPQAALKLYAPYLSLYERAEILEYPQIYFVGQHAQKKQATPEQSANNFGFDDERGDYNIIVQDHLCFRYEVIETLGKGSFGQVVKAFDHKTGQTCAIKIIRNKKRFHCQALVEVKILENLVKWDPEDKHNNVRMTDHFYFRNHLCISCECLSINLYEFIKSNNFQGFSLGLIRRFTTQLLNSLSLLYSHSVVHCDLKPENVLLKHPTKSGIKVIDFGSSCLENEKVYTYIQSRFYRSPEVILGMTYNMAIDMWSLGCILAELYTGYPLFPGENEQEQLACIMEVQGVPERYLVEKSTRKKLFFDSNGNPRIIPNSKGKKRRPGTKTLQQVLKCNDPIFVDFVARCLDWDPEKRMTPEGGLHHEWILEGNQKPSKNAASAPVTPIGYDKATSKKNIGRARKDDDNQSTISSKSTSSISTSQYHSSLLIPTSSKTTLSGSTSLYVPTSSSRRLQGDSNSDVGVSGIGRYSGSGSLGRTGMGLNNSMMNTSSSYRTVGSVVTGDGSSYSYLFIDKY
ncbi:hypothetical protein BC936DRAFT_143010 [Jimgerdemannia flammicorona]|uniref:dual-specificity kinase n=1 Tax=Jimgerdemannia flammicorona TaxID=994334 RepID=A0A433DEE8_9FUNG|nr:hypothetical protein BC936DRAFT_143010 [Jimgerdemannia flammicorona]